MVPWNCEFFLTYLSHPQLKMRKIKNENQFILTFTRDIKLIFGHILEKNHDNYFLLQPFAYRGQKVLNRNFHMKGSH